jgi:hypothetical protein
MVKDAFFVLMPVELPLLLNHNEIPLLQPLMTSVDGNKFELQ